MTDVKGWPKNSLNKVPLWTHRLFVGLTVLAAAYFLVVYAVIAFLRMAYPYELEWMEGGMVDHVARVIEGKPLYVEPTVDFVPYIYPPLYYWISAGITFVTGLGFFPLRLTAFVSSIVVFVFIFEAVRRETGTSLWAFLATGLYAAFFRIGGAWFDLARVDSTALAILAVCLFLMRFGSGSRSAIAAGILGVAVVFTKQSLGIPVMFGCLGMFFISFHRASLTISVGAVTGIAALLGYDAATNGWFGFYVFTLPQTHPWNEDVISFWTSDLFERIPLGTLAMLAIVPVSRFAKSKDSLTFWCCCLGGLVLSAWLSRLHTCGYDNVLLPAYLAAALAFGFVGGELQKHEMLRDAFGSSLLLAIANLQFFMLIYDPIAQVPSQADWEAGKRFEEVILAYDGPVLIPDHGYYARRAGKPAHAHQMAVDDIVRGDNRNLTVVEIRTRLKSSIRDWMKESRWDAVITGSLPNRFQPFIGYRKTSSLETILGSAFYPITGHAARPSFIYESEGESVKN